MTTTLAFIDTETTSLRPGRQIWEAAIIRVTLHDDGNEDITETSFFLDNIDIQSADPASLKIGRFWDRHPHALQMRAIQPAPAEMLPPVRAAKRILRLTHDATLIGSNPHFDAHSLERLLRGQGMQPTWDYRLIDVPTLAAGWLGAKGHEVPLPLRSQELSEACQVQPPAPKNRHTALGDARWIMRWWFKIALNRDV